MKAWYVKLTIFCNCGSNNWETVVDTADTPNAPHLPKAKAYTNFKLGRRTEPRLAKVTILILLLRAAFSD